MRFLRIGLLLGVTLGPAILAVACAAAPTRAATVACSRAGSSDSETLESEYPAFKRLVEASPFYRLLAARLGSPRLCVRDVTAGALRLTYEFLGGGRLEARTDPRIGLNDQRLALDGLSPSEAQAVLQATERDAFGQDGCGISWGSSPVREDAGGDETRELVYRGNVCNCQARLVYRQGRLAQLGFRAAC